MGLVFQIPGGRGTTTGTTGTTVWGGVAASAMETGSSHHQRQASVPEQKTYVTDIDSSIEDHFKQSLIDSKVRLSPSC